MRARLLVGVFCAVGCHRDPVPPAPSSTQKPAEHVPMPSDEKPPIGERVDPLVELLGSESKNRPTGTVTAEQTFAALSAAGLPLKPAQQVVARTVKALYCSRAVTAEGLGVAVCEYPDEAQASAGREYSLKTFHNLMPARTLEVSGKTVINVSRGANETPAVKEQSDKALAAWKQLVAKK